jgi:hypothetical protein
MADGESRALHAVLRLFSPPQPLPALPDEMGHGVVVLITQNVAAATLGEARRLLTDKPPASGK